MAAKPTVIRVEISARTGAKIDFTEQFESLTIEEVINGFGPALNLFHDKLVKQELAKENDEYIPF